ncbi:hypothetical protein BKA64DRAFT_581884 [Cadophora sp. MPI-SDFR-AT-0126]|nr:hypothetical protein BKA64DRAFT_581884 [Leotiomycetes sp. MPI-SDFR-AT-0126]
MAPNSRPPLTSRIRASFEAGDSEVNSPVHANGFITQDPDSIRHAVDQAINGEAFQTAIAANLAKLIKPSIKSALDTIQPVVEAVYAHEMLLRKTNQSVEDVLSRMDTNAETAAAARRESFIDSTYVAPGTPADGEKSADAVEGAVKPREIVASDLDQFKQLMEEYNAKTLASISEAIEPNATKIAELAQGVSDLNASMGPTKESIEFLKSASEQANTTSSVLQAQLDQLKLDIGQIMDTIGADLGKNIQAMSEKSGAPDANLLSSHTTKLDLISTDLAALKGHADTAKKIDAMSSELGALKASVEAGNASNAERFTNVLAALGDHTTVLGEIKEKAPHPEILEALQQSNDSHALHTTTLSEIKERSLGSAPAPVISEGGSVDHSSALQQIQTDLTALKENITAGHTTNSDLGAKIDTVLTTIEEHRAGDPGVEILAAVKQSNESHAAHAATLEGLKSNSTDVNPELGTQITGIEIRASTGSHSSVLDEIKLASTTHADALEGIKSPGIPAVTAADPMNLAALEIQIGSIISTLETHSAAWNEIKARSDPASTEVVPTDTGSESGAPEGPFATIIETLMLHTNLLNEIKEDVAAEILTALHDIGQSQANQTNLLTEIREADLDDEILTLLHASSESHANHTSALDNIHTAVLLSNESIDAAPAEGANLGALEAQLGSIVMKLDDSTAVLSAIKDATGMSNESHAAHAAILADIKGKTASSPSATTAPENTDLSALETQITSILTTLESQTATLSAIQEGTAAANPEILAAIQQSHDLLSSHGPLLESIKEGTSHGDILTNISELKSILEESKADVASHGALVKDLHAETKDSHSELASAIGALALGGAAGAGATAFLYKDDDSDSAVLDEVKAVRALIETSAANVEDTREKVATLANQIEINHTTITTSISTLSDEIKAEIDATGTGIVESITALNGDLRAIDISPLSTSLEQHGADIKTLSTQLDNLDSNIKENNTHITTLHSGVHLNDTGIDQLKDHAVSRSVPFAFAEEAEPMPMTEGAWFGSARSGSRSPTLSRAVSRSAVEPAAEDEEPLAQNVISEEEPPPETVSEVVDDAPRSIEDPVLRAEPVAEDHAESKDMQVDDDDDDLPKLEEAIDAETLPAEHVVAETDLIPSEAAEIDTSDELEPVEDVAVDNEHELLAGDEAVEAYPIPAADEVKAVDEPGPEAAVDLPSDENSIAGDASVETDAGPTEQEHFAETQVEDVAETTELPKSESIVEDASVVDISTVENTLAEEPDTQETKVDESSIEQQNISKDLSPQQESTPIEESIATSASVDLPEGATPSFQPQSQPDTSKGKAIASPGPLSPDLGSPAEFGFSREETETEPESALASPTSPAFSEGGTMVESGGGKKKKKGKKDKKKGKKEKVPFEMEGEDAE